MTKAAEKFSKNIDYTPKQEQDIFNVLEDQKVDILINTIPNQWHTPEAILAMKSGKHVYGEKPISCNMKENELLVEVAKKIGKVIQMKTNNVLPFIHNKSSRKSMLVLLVMPARQLLLKLWQRRSMPSKESS